MSDIDTTLRPTVTSVINALFEAKDRETIIQILMEECNAERLYTTSADPVERIQLAVLKLSNGEVDKFLATAELAQLDWRDVLVASGFGSDLEAHLKWASDNQ